MVASLGIVDLGAQAECMGAGVQMAEQLPENEYRDYYGPDFRLVIPTNNELHNENTQTYLDALCKRLLHNLSQCDTPFCLACSCVQAHCGTAGELAPGAV